jgi:transcriptional regulator with XRE-family HTH domain
MTTASAKHHKSYLSEAIAFIKESMGREVRYRREQAGLSQADLAKEADVRVETISRIEREKGNPTLDTLDNIVRALGRLGA